MEHMSTREKMKSMTKKQKVEYIWHYYKFHIIVAIVIISFIGYIISTLARQKETVLSISIYGSIIDLSKMDALEKKANAQLVNNPKKVIIFEFMTKKETDSDQYKMALLQKLQASIAAGDADILILDQSDFELFVRQGTFRKLSTIPALSKLNLTDNDFVKSRVEGEDTKDEVYGIKADSIPILAKLDYDVENKVLCIVSNTNKLNKASEFLQWLFKQTFV